MSLVNVCIFKFVDFVVSYYYIIITSSYSVLARTFSNSVIVLGLL